MLNLHLNRTIDALGERCFALCVLSCCLLFTQLGLVQYTCAQEQGARSGLAVPTKRVSTSKALSQVSSILKSKGISKLPSTSTLVSSSSTSKSSAQILEDFVIDAVSGTPPTLLGISLNSIKDLFWLPGIVDAIGAGNPSRAQCLEFLSSDIDGHSGGLGACQMAEAVGHSFQTLLDAETSLCYMKNLPTKINLNAGGVKLNKGTFPDGDIRKLFSPGESRRIIKVNVPPINELGPTESIFIRVSSQTSLSKHKLFYQAQLYFCPEGQDAPRGVNFIDVSDKGEMTLIASNRSDPFGGGAHSISVRGFLTPLSSSTDWDPTKTRNSTVEAIQDDGARTLKSDFSITADQLIFIKQRATFSDSIAKNYAVTHFSGSNISNISFLEGAYKGEDTINSVSREFNGAAEFRDIFYASAPGNYLVPQLTSVDLTDSFYTQDPTISLDTSPYSCKAKPNIEITLVRGNTTLNSSLGPCFHREFQNTEFCRTDDNVQRARRNFRDACIRRFFN